MYAPLAFTPFLAALCLAFIVVASATGVFVNPVVTYDPVSWSAMLSYDSSSGFVGTVTFDFTFPISRGGFPSTSNPSFASKCSWVNSVLVLRCTVPHDEVNSATPNFIRFSPEATASTRNSAVTATLAVQNNPNAFPSPVSITFPEAVIYSTQTLTYDVTKTALELACSDGVSGAVEGAPYFVGVQVNSLTAMKNGFDFSALSCTVSVEGAPDDVHTCSVYEFSSSGLANIGVNLPSIPSNSAFKLTIAFPPKAALTNAAVQARMIALGYISSDSTTIAQTPYITNTELKQIDQQFGVLQFRYNLNHFPTTNNVPLPKARLSFSVVPDSILPLSVTVIHASGTPVDVPVTIDVNSNTAEFTLPRVLALTITVLGSAPLVDPVNATIDFTNVGLPTQSVSVRMRDLSYVTMPSLAYEAATKTISFTWDDYKFSTHRLQIGFAFSVPFTRLHYFASNARAMSNVYITGVSDRLFLQNDVIAFTVSTPTSSAVGPFPGSVRFPGRLSGDSIETESVTVTAIAIIEGRNYSLATVTYHPRERYDGAAFVYDVASATAMLRLPTSLVSGITSPSGPFSGSSVTVSFALSRPITAEEFDLAGTTCAAGTASIPCFFNEDGDALEVTVSGSSFDLANHDKYEMVLLSNYAYSYGMKINERGSEVYVIVRLVQITPTLSPSISVTASIASAALITPLKPPLTADLPCAAHPHYVGLSTSYDPATSEVTVRWPETAAGSVIPHNPLYLLILRPETGTTALDWYKSSCKYLGGSGAQCTNSGSESKIVPLWGTYGAKLTWIPESLPRGPSKLYIQTSAQSFNLMGEASVTPFFPVIKWTGVWRDTAAAVLPVVPNFNASVSGAEASLFNTSAFLAVRLTSALPMPLDQSHIRIEQLHAAFKGLRLSLRDMECYVGEFEGHAGLMPTKETMEPVSIVEEDRNIDDTVEVTFDLSTTSFSLLSRPLDTVFAVCEGAQALGFVAPYTRDSSPFSLVLKYSLRSDSTRTLGEVSTSPSSLGPLRPVPESLLITVRSSLSSATDEPYPRAMMTSRAASGNLELHMSNEMIDDAPFGRRHRAQYRFSLPSASSSVARPFLMDSEPTDSFSPTTVDPSAVFSMAALEASFPLSMSSVPSLLLNRWIEAATLPATISSVEGRVEGQYRCATLHGKCIAFNHCGYKFVEPPHCSDVNYPATAASARLSEDYCLNSPKINNFVPELPVYDDCKTSSTAALAKSSSTDKYLSLSLRLRSAPPSVYTLVISPVAAHTPPLSSLPPCSSATPEPSQSLCMYRSDRTARVSFRQPAGEEALDSMEHAVQVPVAYLGKPVFSYTEFVTDYKVLPADPSVPTSRGNIMGGGSSGGSGGGGHRRKRKSMDSYIYVLIVFAAVIFVGSLIFIIYRGCRRHRRLQQQQSAVCMAPVTVVYAPTAPEGAGPGAGAGAGAGGQAYAASSLQPPTRPSPRPSPHPSPRPSPRAGSPAEYGAGAGAGAGALPPSAPPSYADFTRSLAAAKAPSGTTLAPPAQAPVPPARPGQVQGPVSRGGVANTGDMSPAPPAYADVV